MWKHEKSNISRDVLVIFETFNGGKGTQGHKSVNFCVVDILYPK
jgi:hypothetical protein